MPFLSLQKDVAIMKDMKLDAYRFSISWSRLLPSNVDIRLHILDLGPITSSINLFYLIRFRYIDRY